MQNYFTSYSPEKYRIGRIHRIAILLSFAFIQLVLLIGTSSTNTLQAQCSITVKPTVSGCYLSSGSSKATISVEVGWANPPSGGQITVTGPTGSVPATRTIKIGDIATSYEGTDGTVFETTVFIGSPQVVAFEVPADGSTGKTVTARFSSSCTATSAPFNIPAACQATTCPTGQLGGTVFFDYNANGVREKGEAGGLSENEGLLGVTVKIFDCNGALVGTTTTNGFGKYSFNVPAKAYPVRVEFSNLASYAGQGTLSGTDNKTTVQFVKAPDCNVDLGILNPTDYCQSFPRVITSCFVNGDPLASGSATASGDALVSFKYGKTGPKDGSAVTMLADAAKVGSVWGVAYDKYKERLFTSAVLRRHSGLGPAGLGGIYVTNMITNATSTYVDLESAPLSINLGTIPSNSGRGLPTTLSGPSNDQAAFALVGKAGIGDLEISEDGQFLYFTNLHDKKLYKLNISGATPTLAGSYAIPSVCSGGSNRPFGLKVYQGKVYVGTVCDGQTSTSTSNLRAVVQSFDPATTNFTEIFNFPLTYPKGPVFLSTSAANAIHLTQGNWNNWSDNFNDLNTGIFSTNTNSFRVIYPQPILSDIEFDIDGSMILSLADRTGMQTGFQNYAPTGTTDLYSAFSGGDILRAAKSGSTFVLENNGKVDGITGSDPDNNQGPGFGEFYNDDYLSTDGRLNHSEQAFGALALLPGSGKVILTAMDPLNREAGGELNSGGVKYLNNDTGKPDSDATAGFILYTTDVDPGTFAKSTGLGDLELTCDLPTYLEIGNYVWNDVNKNGVQEACEKPLAGINVTLYKGTSKLATTKTTTNGEYYFSSKSRLGTGWTGTGADTTLLENTAYRIVFGEGQLTGSLLNVAGLGQFEATTMNATTNNGNTQNDSDVALASGAFSISFSTTTSGRVNHTFDTGFVCVIPSIGNKVTITPPTCSGVTSQNNGKVSLSAATTPFTKFRVKTGTAAWTGDTTFATATAIGSTFPFDLKTSVPNTGATYEIRFYIGECCYKDTTITVAPKNCACTQPTLGTPLSVKGTCTTGTPNNNAKASVTVTGGDKADIVEGATYGSGPVYNAGSNVTVSSGSVNFANLKHNTQYTIRVWNADNTCFADVTFITATINCCVKPVAGATPKVQTICVGGTVSAYTTTLSTGVEYTWYGPLADTTSSLGTAISGQTAASYTPTGVALTTTGTKYYAVIINTTGNVACADTAFVQLVVNDKPVIADGAATICADETVDLTSKITNYATYLSPVWTVATAGGTSVSTATAVKPTATTTYVLIAQNAAGCKDTANVVVTVNPKPNAGTDQTLACANTQTNTLTTTTTLVPITAGGTFTQIGTAPAVATIAGNAVSGMTVAGTYQFQYNVAGCLDTVAVNVEPCTGCVKPDAGPDVTLTCPPTGIAPTTATLAPLTAGGTWAAQTGNPATASVTGNNVTGLTLAGTYKFIFSVTGGGQTCTDTVQVIVPTCVQPKGSLGDFVWKDTNNNGIQDETTPNAGGVAGVQIELYKVGTASAIAKDTTDATGKYLFSNLDAGQYYIKVLAASLPAGCTISTMKDVTAGGGTEANDSDVDPTTGQSGNYTIDPLDPAKKDIVTVDGALVIPCVKSNVTLTAAPVCSADVQTYSLTFSITNKVGIVKVNKGTLTGSNPYTVTGIPSGETLKITDSLSAACKFDTLITGPNCNCNPPVPTLVTPSLTACISDTFPTIKATVVGLATVEWFATATSTTVLFTGLNYKPAGTVPSIGAVFYAQARSTDPSCPAGISTSRVMTTINAQNCTKEVDLALKKSINTKIAQIGDVLTYTLKVWNESNTNATGVEVTDSIPTTVQFQTGSFTASRGTATITGNVIKWVIGSIAANGDTVTLTYRVKATQEGVHFNTAEISKTNEKDIDSTPGNGKEGEDDIDHQCFSVPIKLCLGEKVEANVPASLTNVQWFKNGGTTAVASGNTVLLTDVGIYTFTATNQTCPLEGCCPIIIEPGVNCCPEDLCIPFTIKKRKK